MAMGPMMGCLVAFQAERVVFIREHSTGSYSTLTYYLAKVLSDFPFITVMPILQGTISYWMVGYQAKADKYFIYLAGCICVSLVAHSLGLSISAGAPDMNISMAISPMMFIPLMLLGGFFLNTNSIPDWLIWYVISAWGFPRAERLLIYYLGTGHSTSHPSSMAFKSLLEMNLRVSLSPALQTHPAHQVRIATLLEEWVSNFRLWRPSNSGRWSIARPRLG